MGGTTYIRGDNVNKADRPEVWELTMTKYLSIAILLTGFLAGNAYGDDDIYYCAETVETGWKNVNSKLLYYA